MTARTRSRKRRTAALRVLVLCAAAWRGAGAQGTALVPVTDPAYADVDRLASLGALDSVVVGQRPYSRRELTRIVRIVSARASADGARRSMIDGPLRRLSARFGREAADAPALLMQGAALAAGSTDAPRRAFSGSVTRSLEATIGPIAERRLGPPAPPGEIASLEVAPVLAPASWLALDADARVEQRAPRDGSTDHRHAELLRGGARARIRNMAPRVGREQMAWAPRAGDGLFLASDAPALDLVALSGDAPFTLPGPLRALGPTQATLVVADLGPSAVRSHSKLVTYKVSVLPHRSLELGATFMNHFGGEGAPPASLASRLVDFLPFVDIFRTHNYTDPTRPLDVESDKLLGVDGRWRAPVAGGLVVTTELLIDDFDVHRIPTLFTWDGAQTFGAELPTVAGSAISMRVSAKHTGVRTYTHGTLSDGITTRGRLLGEELGPDAKAFGAALGWHPARPMTATVGARAAIYSRADYVTVDNGSHFTIQRLGPASNELRDQVTATLAAALRPEWWLTVRLAGERVRNADFAGGVRRDYAADVALRYVR